MIRISGLTAVLVGIIMTSCGTVGLNSVPKSEPDFTGFITNIVKGGTGGIVGRIMVESHADKLVHRHVVKLTKETVILRREGEQDQAANIESVKLKDWVKLWFSEPGQDSYPDEVTAQKILIVDRP
ncbi:MAG: hypothetical protein ACR2HX_25185 [Pyrinomonadaceae bacterium]